MDGEPIDIRETQTPPDFTDLLQQQSHAMSIESVPPGTDIEGTVLDVKRTEGADSKVWGIDMKYRMQLPDLDSDAFDQKAAERLQAADIPSLLPYLHGRQYTRSGIAHVRFYKQTPWDTIIKPTVPEVREVFEKKNIQIPPYDLSLPFEYMRTADTTANLLLGLKLIKSDLSYEAFQKIVSESGTEFDNDGLRKGFIHLLSERNLKKLLQTGMIQESELDSIYEKSCVWILNITKADQIARSTRKTNNYPYAPFPVTNPQTPHPPIDAMPYLLSMFLDYYDIDMITQFVANGSAFNPQSAHIACAELVQFVQGAIQSQVQDGSVGLEDAQTLLNEQLNPLVGELNETLQRYQQNPKLLNKRESVASAAVFPGSYSYLKKLRDAGATAGNRFRWPRKWTGEV